MLDVEILWQKEGEWANSELDSVFKLIWHTKSKRSNECKGLDLECREIQSIAFSIIEHFLYLKHSLAFIPHPYIQPAQEQCSYVETLTPNTW
jgi:hypothetical protein